MKFLPFIQIFEFVVLRKQNHKCSVLILLFSFFFFFVNYELLM